MSVCSFFVTAGRGTEKFAEKEIKDKLNTVGNVCRLDGKVFFSLEAKALSVEELLNLKSIERLFISVLKEKTSQSIGSIASFIKEFIDKNVQHIENCRKLMELFLVEQLQQNNNFGKNIKKRGRYCQLDAKEECEPAQKMRRSVNNYSSVDILECSTEKGANTATMVKSCNESGRESCRDTNQTIGIEDKLSEDSEKDPDAGCNSPNGIRQKYTLTFRVSCKCRGKFKNDYKVQSDIITLLGKHLAELWQLKVDLRHPSFELFVHINDNDLIIGLPVTQIPLSKRPYMKKIGLRCSVAWIIGHLASIEKGSVVLDPMCGAATILVEAAIAWPSAVYIGCDNDKEQLEIAKENIQSLRSWHLTLTDIELIEGDATSLAFLHSEVDTIICDIPFGKKFGRKEEALIVYPRLFVSWDNVLTPGGKVVVLCSRDSVYLVKKCFAELLTGRTKPLQITGTDKTLLLNKQDVKPFEENKCDIQDNNKQLPKQVPKWREITVEYVSLGVTQACICVFEKVL